METQPALPNGTTDLVASRAQINQAKQLAAALLPLLVERLGAQTTALDDPEVTGKAIDRLAKLAGASDDKGTSMKPIIHFTISSSGAQMSVKAKPADEPEQELIIDGGKPVFESPFAIPSADDEADIEDAVIVKRPLMDTEDT